MSDDLNTLFGALRSLLADTGEERADALWALLRRAHALAPDVYDAAWRPYLAAHADRLPGVLWRVERWQELALRAALLPPRLDACLQLPLEDTQHQRMGPRWETRGLDAATSLRVYGDVEALADRAPLHALRRLDLSCNRLRTDDALRLLTRDALPNLRALDLRHCWLFGPQTAQLLATPALLALEELSIGGEELPDALIAALPAYMERASGLHTLHIAHRPARSDLGALLDALTKAPPHITTITLTIAPPHAETLDMSRVAHTLAQTHTQLPALRGLSLSDGAWSGIAVSALARWPGLASLRDLSLTHIQGPLEPLLSSPHLRELTALHIDDAGVSAACMAAIGEMAALERLHASRCQLTRDQLDALRASPALQHLTSLALPGAEVEGALSLLDAPRLAHLDLNSSDLSEALLSDLPARPQAPLTRLDLSYINAPPELAAALGRCALHHLKHLELFGWMPAAPFLASLTPDSLPALRDLSLTIDEDTLALHLLTTPATAALLPSLESLALWDPTDDEALHALLAGPLARQLRAFAPGIEDPARWERFAQVIRAAGFTSLRDETFHKPRFV